MKISSNPIDIVAHVRGLPPILQSVITSSLSSICAYFSCFGVIAIFGIWRATLFDGSQLVLFSSILLLILSLCRFAGGKKMAATIICGGVLSAGLLIYVLAVASKNDYPQVLIVVLMPMFLCLVSAKYVAMIERELDKK
jgi:hypothetical protein